MPFIFLKRAAASALKWIFTLTRHTKGHLYLWIRFLIIFIQTVPSPPSGCICLSYFIFSVCNSLVVGRLCLLYTLIYVFSQSISLSLQLANVLYVVFSEFKDRLKKVSKDHRSPELELPGLYTNMKGSQTIEPHKKKFFFLKWMCFFWSEISLKMHKLVFFPQERFSVRAN